MTESGLEAKTAEEGPFSLGPSAGVSQRTYEEFPDCHQTSIQSNSGALCDASYGGKHKEKLEIPLYGDTSCVA